MVWTELVPEDLVRVLQDLRREANAVLGGALTELMPVVLQRIGDDSEFHDSELQFELLRFARTCILATTDVESRGGMTQWRAAVNSTRPFHLISMVKRRGTVIEDRSRPTPPWTRERDDARTPHAAGTSALVLPGRLSDAGYGAPGRLRLLLGHTVVAASAHESWRNLGSVEHCRHSGSTRRPLQACARAPSPTLALSRAADRVIWAPCTTRTIDPAWYERHALVEVADSSARP